MLYPADWKWQEIDCAMKFNKKKKELPKSLGKYTAADQLIDHWPR